jgi:hypothetical protein
MDYYKRNFTGEINIVEKNNKMQYRLLSKTDTNFNNLEVDYILQEPYMGFWYVDVKIHIDNELVFNKKGVLEKAIKFGNEEWFIKSKISGSVSCIGDVLFDNVGKKALIVIQKL